MIDIEAIGAEKQATEFGLLSGTAAAQSFGQVGKTMDFEDWKRKLEARRLEEEKPKCEHFWLPLVWKEQPTLKTGSSWEWEKESYITKLYCAKCLKTREF